MTALVTMGVLSFVWDQHFQSYTQENMQTLANQTAENIEAVYAETGTLYSDQVRAMAQYSESLNNGVGIAIIDNSNGHTVYDSSEVIDSDGSVDGSDAESNPFKGSVSTSLSLSRSEGHFASAAITVNGSAVGSVRVWVYGSELLLRQADQQFQRNSYQAMVFASVLAIVLASCIGWLFARNLVAPVNSVAQTAQKN
jgi:hypothetical protein